MAWRLIVVLGERTLRFDLAPGEHVLGSQPDCQVRLADASVSRRHALLRVGAESVCVEDLGSRNGTRRDGERVARTSWLPGETLQFGRVKARLEDVTSSDLQAAVELGVGGGAGGAEALDLEQSTHSTGPVEVWALGRLPALAQAVAEGRGPAELAALCGTSMAECLPGCSVEISAGECEARGVLFSTGWRDGGDERPAWTEGRHGRFAVRLGFSSSTQSQRHAPLARVAAALLASSERGTPVAERARREVTVGPAQPDPPSVEPGIQEIYSQARRVARGDVSVLILGESGTGKEVLARFIHAASRRASGPFLGLNCAALGRDLLEAELFGIEKGVATGVDARPGKFEQAHGGTLFLDEIGDMGPETQAKILRVLQSGEVFRLGSREPRMVSVRVLAATNRAVDRMVAVGEFRRDLYHRIAGWVVEMPPLRRRRGDIPNLAAFFLGREATRLGVRVAGISRAAVEALVSYSWPGNVRELENEMARAALFLEDGELLDSSRLASQIAEARPRRGHMTLAETLAVIERSEIVRVLISTGGDMDAAAAELGVSRATLYRRVKDLGIEIRRHEDGT
ncbi:MAG: sigma 54-interacting transcriptional regulator [Thermoanaerobaculaceae bacterium]